jgi:hypothetical protein
VGLSTLLDEGALGTVLERALAACGRRPADYLALHAVRARGPFGTLAELADHLLAEPRLELDRAAALALLDRLRAEGLLSTTPVRLTARGVEVHDGLRRDVIRIAAQGPPFV